MEKQIIVSISREFGSCGRLIADMVSKKLGLNLYDRKMLDEIASEKNVSVEVLEKYDESPRKLLLSRRIGEYSNAMEEVLAQMQFDYIRKKAESNESFVVVGRCADTVLKDYDSLVKIFITGDLEWKKEAVMNKYNISEDEALAKMSRHDRKRKQYHNRHSDFKWGDSRHYDLCINSSKLGIEKTAEIIEEFVRGFMEMN